MSKMIQVLRARAIHKIFIPITIYSFFMLMNSTRVLDWMNLGELYKRRTNAHKTTKTMYISYKKQSAPNNGMQNERFSSMRPVCIHVNYRPQKIHQHRRHLPVTRITRASYKCHSPQAKEFREKLPHLKKMMDAHSYC